MKYVFLDGYCLSKVGAVKDFKEEWNAIRYLVGDKMFLMQGENKEKRPIITFKCEPLFNDFLREKYLDITPGYYMNKDH